MSAPAAIAILGAGCAGTAVAKQLLEAGFGGRIDLFNTRQDFSGAQRWCFWDRQDSPYAALATTSWPAWSVTDATTCVRRTASDIRYFHVAASDYFREEHARLAKDSRVRLLLGAHVAAIREEGDAFMIEAGGEGYRADCVIDARHQVPAHPAQGQGGLYQSFVGEVIRTQQPVFDPTTLSLMDFAAAADSPLAAEGLPFLYVLPYAPNRALVEFTLFSATPVPMPVLEAELHRVLQRYGRHQVEEQETGALWLSPKMRRAANPIRPGWYLAGAQAGCIRPASGYAFLPIQRQACALARHLVHNEPLPGWAPVLNVLDELLLELIATRPEVLPRCFARLFERCPAEALIRFLTEVPRGTDLLRVVAALPKAPFLRVSLEHAVRKLGSRVVSDSQSVPSLATLRPR